MTALDGGEEAPAPVAAPVPRSGAGIRLAAVGWLVVLAATVAVGVMGGAQNDDRVAVADPSPNREAARAATPAPAPVRPSVRSGPTRPPIGEDGIMGGLPFGTAWLWLRPQAD